MRPLLCLRPLLLSAALLLPSSAGAAQRLSQAVAPLREALQLTLDPAQPGYSGTAVIELEVRERADSIRFHARDLRIRQARLESRGRPPLALTARAGEAGLVAAGAPKPIEPGRYTLRLEFEREFMRLPRGLYKVVVGDDAYAFTDFEPDDARRAWPCFDEPAFKIPWQLTVTIPEGSRAVSNTPAASDKVSGGRRTVVFRELPPTSSYLVALAVGPLEFTDIPGMSVPGRVVTVKGRARLAGEAVRLTPPLLAALESYFGERYPYEKLDLIAVPEFYAGAMENPGAITYREDRLLVDPETASALDRAQLASLTAHELAHIWFGDLVTLSWWDEIWLNESFASWLGEKTVSRAFPAWGIDLRAANRMQQALVTDALPTTTPIRRPVAPGASMAGLFNEISYQKGQAVLGMFEGWLGEETFRDGIRAYVRGHAWKNATSGDLWAALAGASGKDVAGVMAGFVDQAGVPLVGVEPLDGGRVRVRQERFRNLGSASAPARWRIPVALRHPGGTHAFLLEDSVHTVELPGAAAPGWILPNARQTGYYRWTLPAASRTALVAAAGELSARERLGVVANAGALLDAGELHGDEYLELLARFAADEEPEVVAAVLAGLTKVRDTFVDGTDGGAFAAYVRRTLSPVRARWGLSPAAGEPNAVTRVRPDLLLWLGDDGRDPAVLAHAESLAALQRAGRPVESSVAGVALRLAALRGDAALWAEYRARLLGAATPDERARYVEALSGFRAPALVDSVLDLVLRGPLLPQEQSLVPRGLVARPELRQRVYDWMTASYDALLRRASPRAAAYLPYYAGGCSAERLAAARAFFAQPEHDLPGVADEMAKVAARVGDCVRLRERESAAVERALRQASASH